MCLKLTKKKKKAEVRRMTVPFSFVHFDRVAGKLPQPNLVLLKHLLCVLYHISRNSAVNKMDSNNLAICVGPSILSPDHNKHLPLEAQKELTDKVCLVLFPATLTELERKSEGKYFQAGSITCPGITGSIPTAL